MKKTTNNVGLTCPNNACKKVITRPLTTLNLQQTSKKPYNACPYCLTEITITETENKTTPDNTTTEISFVEEKTSQNEEKLSTCKHYFGYMNDKEHKQQMPEECMLCSQIIDCMVKENESAKGKTQITK